MGTLLHDIGHGPFSHCFERAIKCFLKKKKKEFEDTDQTLSFEKAKRIEGIQNINHERWTQKIITNKDDSEIYKKIQEHEMDHEKIASIFKKLFEKSFSPIDLRFQVSVFVKYLSFNPKKFIFRLIGFWNPANKCYHWYVTNLSVPAKLIYPLYRLRWQCELLFKAAKSSLNLSDISSSDVNIIQSLVLGSIAVMALTQPLVLNMSLLYQKDMKLFQVPSIIGDRYFLHSDSCQLHDPFDRGLTFSIWIKQLSPKK